MSAICPGLRIRGITRRSPAFSEKAVNAAADAIMAKPERLTLFEFIALNRGVQETDELTRHPEWQSLVSRSLVRFYSSYRRRKPWFAIYLLSKGDRVWEEIQRRITTAENKAIEDQTYLFLYRECA